MTFLMIYLAMSAVASFFALTLCAAAKRGDTYGHPFPAETHNPQPSGVVETRLIPTQN